MGVFTRRALTAGEVALGRALFGEEVAWGTVRVAQLPPLGFAAMVPTGRTILYSRARARLDFVQAPLAEQGLFVHELAHVWQAERGVVLALAKLLAIGRGAYRVEMRAGARFAAYNIEAQAEIVRLLFLTRAGVDTGAPRAWFEEVWSTRGGD